MDYRKLEEDERVLASEEQDAWCSFATARLATGEYTEAAAAQSADRMMVEFRERFVEKL